MYDFIKWDESKILEEAIEIFEKESGDTLYAGDERRLMINSYMYIASVIASKANFLSNQQLVEFMDEEHLLLYGKEINVLPIEGEVATVSIRFHVDSQKNFDITIPKGTRVTPNGSLFFVVPENNILYAGNQYIDIECISNEVGQQYNGFKIGEIATLTDLIPYIVTVENITKSTGGIDKEKLEEYRTRVMLKPSSFSTAGAEDAYKYLALSADSRVKDVTVISNDESEEIEACNVIVTIVGEDGELLEEEVVHKVSEYIQDESVKVLNEVVTVQNPIVNPYTVELSYTIAQDNINNMNEIQEAVENAVLQYVKSQDSKIGGSINPYVLNQLVILAGAFTVDIKSPTLKQLTKQDIAKCTTSKITYSGII